MTSRLTFFSSYTATAKAKAHDIWLAWKDVNNWNKWDQGIANSAIQQTFEEGSVFSLTPHGGQTISVMLKKVVPDQEFSDEAILPFGIIRNFHRIKSNNNYVFLTHEICVEVDPDSVDFFATEIWAHMQKELPDTVHNLLKNIS